MNEWVATFDFASLYPRTQMQFKIAPENYKGMQMKNKPNFAEFNGKITPIEDSDVVCINGNVFKNEDSVTINFLKDVYSQRKHFKNMMKDNLKQIDQEQKDLAELEKKLEEMSL